MHIRRSEAFCCLCWRFLDDNFFIYVYKKRFYSSAKCFAISISEQIVRVKLVDDDLGF